MILFKGPSVLDPATRIVVIATGFDRPSANQKTGGMLQVYTLVESLHPMDAIRVGLVSAICGDCPLIGDICYLQIHKDINKVYNCYKRGGYRYVESIEEIEHLFFNKRVRLGAYGDPAAIPGFIIEAILKYAKAYTSYTHNGQYNPVVAELSQASVESAKQAKDWQAKGYKTFRIKLDSEPLVEDEIACPNEKRPDIQCRDCLLCDGQKANIAVNVHGAKSKVMAFEKYKKALSNLENI